MSQWPKTDQLQPLPSIVRRMPGRPKHKRKRDAFEDDGNRQRLSRVGRVMHYSKCGGEGHNKLTCSVILVEETVETGLLICYFL